MPVSISASEGRWSGDRGNRFWKGTFVLLDHIREHIVSTHSKCTYTVEVEDAIRKYPGPWKYWSKHGGAEPGPWDPKRSVCSKRIARNGFSETHFAPARVPPATFAVMTRKGVTETGFLKTLYSKVICRHVSWSDFLDVLECRDFCFLRCCTFFRRK